MSYSKGTPKFEGSFSGSVTTSTTDEVITIQNGASVAVTAGNIAFKCITACNIKLNDEANYHQFDAGDTFSFEDVAITKFTVQTSASQLKYYGNYYA